MDTQAEKAVSLHSRGSEIRRQRAVEMHTAFAGHPVLLFTCRRVEERGRAPSLAKAHRILQAPPASSLQGGCVAVYSDGPTGGLQERSRSRSRICRGDVSVASTLILGKLQACTSLSIFGSAMLGLPVVRRQATGCCGVALLRTFEVSTPLGT